MLYMYLNIYVFVSRITLYKNNGVAFIPTIIYVHKYIYNYKKNYKRIVLDSYGR